MGVPAFYRWLREKYPKCILNVIEDEEVYVNGGMKVPINLSNPNPNGMEFDNLYLDMNGIIHPCVHPEDGPAPETEEEMFQAIFHYIDRLISAVRPRKLLFMAIDGVAPRAKMNQQRSRRFKAALEIQEREEVEEELRAKMVARGQTVPSRSKSTFDHNVITPGTQFMDRLAKFLQYYTTERINTEAGWRNLRVIISDASVPGEGEHKIMEYIRQQRAQPNYNPNIHHILHGLDADLIMLGLATHEAHFTILREEVLPPKGAINTCQLCGQIGHTMDRCRGTARQQSMNEMGRNNNNTTGTELSSSSASTVRTYNKKPLQFLHIPILREYFDIEFGQLASSLPFAYDIERCIDDLVFMLFFVGNDFLPHLPSMDIREGAIDLLMAIYKQILPALGGYMTHNGNVHLGRVDILLSRVGAVEDEIFRRRRKKEERDKLYDAQRKAQDNTKIKIKTDHQVAVERLLAPSIHESIPVPNKESNSTSITTTTLTSTSSNKVDTVSVPVNVNAVYSGLASLGSSDTGGSEPPTKRVHTEEMHSTTTDINSNSGISYTTTTATTADGIPGLGTVSFDYGSGIPGLGGTMITPIVPLPSEIIMNQATESTVSVGTKRSRTDAEIELSTGISKSTHLVFEETAKGETIVYDKTNQTVSKPTEITATDKLVTDSTTEIIPNVLIDENEIDIDEPTLRPAEALEEALVDEGGEILASAVRGILKDAIAAALTARHTHNDVVDEVRFGENGWKERYYTSKFGREEGNSFGFRTAICKAYTEGLVWVFRYYYQGVASWKWFYPYHYAPFASDLRNLDSFDIQFELGKPFRPLDQLMAVLPALSSHALPPSCQKLMTDPKSPVIDFYPEKFKQDPNGKKFSWQWVVLLPFIDEKRLVDTIDSVSIHFSPDELRRNKLGNEILFCHENTPLGKVLLPLAPTEEDIKVLQTNKEIRSSSTISAVSSSTGHQVDERSIVVNVSDPSGSGDATRVLTPAISPAVMEAFATVTAQASSEGKLAMVILKPDMGDIASKGFSAHAVPLAIANKYGYAATIGGTFRSPWRPVLTDILNNRVLQIGFLPPTRRAHLCHLLVGAEPPPKKLDPSNDDCSMVVPRLTRGISIVDLAHALNSMRQNGYPGGTHPMMMNSNNHNNQNNFYPSSSSSSSRSSYSNTTTYTNGSSPHHPPMNQHQRFDQPPSHGYPNNNHTGYPSMQHAMLMNTNSMGIVATSSTYSASARGPPRYSSYPPPATANGPQPFSFGHNRGAPPSTTHIYPPPTSTPYNAPMQYQQPPPTAYPGYNQPPPTAYPGYNPQPYGQPPPSSIPYYSQQPPSQSPMYPHQNIPPPPPYAFPPSSMQQQQQQGNGHRLPYNQPPPNAYPRR